MPIAIALHTLAATIWVGGMFFAYMALRPAVAALDPLARQALWRRTFARFFPWVWAAVTVLLASGYWMLFVVFGGFSEAGLHIHVMHLIGWVMILLYSYVYFVPYKRLVRSVEAQDPAAGKKSIDRIRRIVAVNTVLGLSNAVVGTAGRYFF